MKTYKVCILTRIPIRNLLLHHFQAFKLVAEETSKRKEQGRKKKQKTINIFLRSAHLAKVQTQRRNKKALKARREVGTGKMFPTSISFLLEFLAPQHGWAVQ